jgi:hypothetical protein
LRDAASGKEYTLLSSDRFIPAAVLGANGSRIFFSYADGTIAGLAPSGGGAEEVCNRCGTVTGASADGRRVLFEPMRDEDLSMWDAQSGTTRKLALRTSPNSVLTGGRFSPDGEWVAFHAFDNRSATARIWIVHTDGVAPAPQSSWIAITDGGSVERDPVWNPAGNLLYYFSERDGFRCIWARRLDAAKRLSGEPFAIRHFHEARWSLSSIQSGFQIGLSADRSRILFALDELTGNIWMRETRVASR